MFEKSGRAEQYGRMVQRGSIHFFFRALFVRNASWRRTLELIRWSKRETGDVMKLQIESSRCQHQEINLELHTKKSKTAKATLVFYWSLGLCVKNLAGDRSGIVSSPPATFTWPGGSMAFVLVRVSEIAMEDGWICATWLLDTAGMCGIRWFCVISDRSWLASI